MWPEHFLLHYVYLDKFNTTPLINTRGELCVYDPNELNQTISSLKNNKKISLSITFSTKNYFIQKFQIKNLVPPNLITQLFINHTLIHSSVFIFLESSKTLTHLSLDDCDLVEVDDNFFNGLKINKTITHLKLTNCRLLYDTTEKLVDILENKPRYQSFDIRYNRMETKVFRKLCRIIEMNRGLQNLGFELLKNYQEPHWSLGIAKALINNSTLIKLFINQTFPDHIDPELVSTYSDILKEALKTNVTLLSFNLAKDLYHLSGDNFSANFKEYETHKLNSHYYNHINSETEKRIQTTVKVYKGMSLILIGNTIINSLTEEEKLTVKKIVIIHGNFQKTQ